ncbi:MBL fold metallo-hydrolase [Defluviimonas sp. WL0024]|uniref:MBL fold metallo-hydrolase n=2 Tax=Albidovulum TaxID=205889 RepID=A0ABT3J3Q8_9RHOB|nr:MULTISPECIES: MBL fold metallo-hydrolase [Defluviimonas]MCU9848625.1 MBL fold metallo-hydrolase [Defluviimonas sp. WL0024]MCW3782307.1 MBL fold metallo-hydrolase [Defluviimonas salinarum]
MKEESRIPPRPGRVLLLEPGLRTVLAPNPSPMTLHGTNSYILGEGEVAVIDPGPADPAHLAALLGALAPGERVSHIFVTHAHLDHSPLARPLAEATGAPVLAFGDARAGRSALMERLAAGGGLAGGEGVDAGFAPDIRLRDGETVEGAGWTLRAVYTPGHMGNHLSFAWQDTVFCGDHVMGWASSLVSPPDGDMGAYMASLARLAATGARRLYSGHGDPIPDAQARIAALAAHRREREAAILGALSRGPADAASLAAMIYTDTPAPLMRAAARNVFAHLLDLMEKKIAEPELYSGIDAHFRLL